MLNIMEGKKAVSSKEIIFGVLVLVNSVLDVAGWPSIPTTPEFVAAVAIVFVGLRRWFTTSPITSWF